MEHKDDKLPGCLKNDPPPPPSSRKCPQATAQAAIKSWYDEQQYWDYGSAAPNGNGVTGWAKIHGYPLAIIANNGILGFEKFMLWKARDLIFLA